jgi:hypothetical protein
MAPVEEANGSSAGVKRSRRGFLAGAAGALGVIATAQAIGTTAPAEAAAGDPITMGNDNDGETSNTNLSATTAPGNLNPYYTAILTVDNRGSSAALYALAQSSGRDYAAVHGENGADTGGRRLRE